MQASKARFEFSKCTINLDLFCIEDGQGKQIFAEPRLLKLIYVLHRHANQVVKRDDLVSQVWINVIVTDESLSKAIFDLRKFLAVHFLDAPRIQTIRKVGYRLELHANGGAVRQSSMLRLSARLVLWTIAIISLIAMVVRAFRYEQ